MTENLAGRGEGLKRLVAKWRKEAEEFGKIYKETGQDRAFRINAIRSTCADELEAALEAAAPASTAHALNLEQLRWLEQLRDEARAIAKGRRDCEWANYRASMADEILAALATPSPQTPPEQCNAFSTTSAREQSAATASDSPSAAAGSPKHREWLDVAMEQGCQCGYSDAWHCARKKGITTSLTCYCHCHKYTSVPAATQEPAGSGAKLANGFNMLRIAEEITRGVSSMSKHATATGISMWVRSVLEREFGSPRKVGEDGALTETQVEDIHKIIERHSTDVIDYELATDDINAYLLRLTVGSQGVGEQKQEEGG